MTRIDWPHFLRMLTIDASGADIARSANVSEATVSRWLAGKAHPNPQQVVSVCRAFGMHPINGLRAAGYIENADDLLDTNMPAPVRLAQFSDLEIAEEMVRRIAEGGSSILEEPLDENHPAMRNVSPIRKDAKSPKRRRPDMVAANEADGPRVEKLRLRKFDPEKAKKKAALTDPEMNTDETFE